MRYSKYQKSKLNDIIIDVSMSSEFIRNPKTDFIRRRKLDFITTFNLILAMGGKSLDRELLDQFNFCETTPTKSAFVQRRDKILPEAFIYAFTEYTKQLRRPNKYKGHYLLGVDGSNVSIYRNPKDTDSFEGRKYDKGFNSLHLSTTYDLLNYQYTDAIVQPRNFKDERDALINMLPNISNNSIVIGDRGYEGYNVFAHLSEMNQKYVIRVKDIDRGSIMSGFNLPNTEFDTILTVNVSNYQRKAIKTLPNYRFSPSIARFDFSNKDKLAYELTFRAVRIHLGEGKYECVITNLSNDFTPSDIKYLYKLRWGIETSFRELKYSVGLANLHAKKKDSIIQEIFAHLTLHNFCKSIIQNTILFLHKNVHEYKINFVMAVFVCRHFLRLNNTTSINVEALISKYLSIVRDHRSSEINLCPKGHTSFVYRVS